MNVTNALAGIAVRDLDAAVDWYARLLGRGPDARPMPGCAEWEFAGGGWIQLFAEEGRAGRSSVTLVEEDLERRLEDLGREGIDVESTSDGAVARIACVADPDGNRVVFAEGAGPANPSASA